MQKLSNNKLFKVKSQPKPLGFILYAGPSTLDGLPIVVIATLKTSNVKTGNMVQTWILRQDLNPVEASKIGADVSLCGNCVQRHFNDEPCYVNLGQAPLAVWKAYKAGKYLHFNSVEHSQYLAGRMVRLGAYGDPAAVPYEVFKSFVSFAIGHTGYTHQIKHKNFDRRYLDLCMVSADTPKQALKYQGMGAKTFRVALEGDHMFDSEIECLSESEGLQCNVCGLCNGKKQSIAITVHGSRSNKFKSKLIAVGA